MQVMVINIQAFQRDLKETEAEAVRGTANVMYVDAKKMNAQSASGCMTRTLTG